MAGMIQIVTYLLAFYLIVKGIEILHSPVFFATRQDRHHPDWSSDARSLRRRRRLFRQHAGRASKIDE